MKCINCGHENPDSARFCEQCGVVLPAVKEKAPIGEPVENSINNIDAASEPAANADSPAAASGANSTAAAAENEAPKSSEAVSTRPEDFNSYYQSQNPQPKRPQYSESAFDPNNIPEEYRPLSMWEYFGYQILFALPVIGFIMLLIFSFGASRNRNLRNFARSYFCMTLIAFIAVLVLGACGLGLSVMGS